MGIDPSLRSTGWSVRQRDGTVTTGHIESGELRGPWRLYYVLAKIRALLDTYSPSLVVYEDYAMGKAKSGQGLAFHIGELGGVIKTEVWGRGISLLLVPPSSLKKVITGVGNPGFTKKGEPKLTDKQKKQIIVDAVKDNFGVHAPQHDEADAAGLMILGEIYCGARLDPKNALTSVRKSAIAQCETVRGKLQSIAKP